MLEFPFWLNTLLEIEAVILTTLLALAIPVTLVMLLRDAWRRNRR